MMKIQELYINNFKSLVDFKLVNPNSFSVFVGPNGAGKSNIFEALEYVNYSYNFFGQSADKLFNGISNYINLNQKENESKIQFHFKFENVRKIEKTEVSFIRHNDYYEIKGLDTSIFNILKTDEDLSNFTKVEDQILTQFYNNFSRIFVTIGKNRLNVSDDLRLNPNADNLEKVLKRVLLNEAKREEIMDWLHLFVPELESIEIHSDNIGGTDTLLIKEKCVEKPLRKNLISDGTYNILALLTAIYQSDEPQFLCIEEPENGLNPYVVKEFVYLCREACKQLGHTIWLNTHSQTLVSKLRPEEIILVNKKEGITKAKQFTKEEQLFGMKMDEAWLSNALGGGLPW